jgi:hypothetical protein
MFGSTLALVADVTVQDGPQTSSKVDGYGDEVGFDLGKLERPNDDREGERDTLTREHRG